MKTETIMPDFKDRAAKIVEVVRNSICIDKLDAEVLKEILQDELDGYYNELDGYYDAGHSDGYAAGYDAGYESGYADCHAKNH